MEALSADVPLRDMLWCFNSFLILVRCIWSLCNTQFSDMLAADQMCIKQSFCPAYLQINNFSIVYIQYTGKVQFVLSIRQKYMIHATSFSRMWSDWEFRLIYYRPRIWLSIILTLLHLSPALPLIFLHNYLNRFMVDTHSLLIWLWFFRYPNRYLCCP